MIAHKLLILLLFSHSCRSPASMGGNLLYQGHSSGSHGSISSASTKVLFRGAAGEKLDNYVCVFENFLLRQVSCINLCAFVYKQKN